MSNTHPRQVWRVLVADRVSRLSARLHKVPSERHQESDYALARDSLEEARKAARLGGEKQGGWAIPNWYTGAAIETAWMALHRAEQALVMFATNDEVRVSALEAKAILAISALDSKDTRRTDYQEQLDRILDKPAKDLNHVDRLALRSIQEFFHSRSDTDHSEIRTFRNVLLMLSAALLVALAIVAVAGWLDPGGLTVCGPAASTSTPALSAVAQTRCLAGTAPRSGDILIVELVGGLGGLVSAVFFLRGLKSNTAPYDLPVALGILKVPTGAATGLIGVLLLQHGLLGVQPVEGPAVVAFAAVFGFAQQALTSFADAKGGSLLSSAQPKDQSGS